MALESGADDGFRNFDPPPSRAQDGEGYLDDFLDILDAHNHPCILLGDWAVRWMGARPTPFYPMSFLVRSSQYEAIALDVINSPHWEETETAGIWKRKNLPPHPRAFRRIQGYAVILLHDETSEKLLVDPPSDEGTTEAFLLEVPDCLALNPVLVEEEMRPSANSDLYPVLREAIETGKPRFLPYRRCQSSCRTPQTKIFVPSIARYIDALVSQIKILNSMEEESWSLGPRYTLELLNRYLYFEAPCQQRKLYRLVDQETKIWLKGFLSKKVRSKTSERWRLEQLLREDEVENLTKIPISTL